MFHNWIKILHLKCAGSALKSSETQVRVYRFLLDSFLANDTDSYKVF